MTFLVEKKKIGYQYLETDQCYKEFSLESGTIMGTETVTAYDLIRFVVSSCLKLLKLFISFLFLQNGSRTKEYCLVAAQNCLGNASCAIQSSVKLR